MLPLTLTEAMRVFKWARWLVIAICVINFATAAVFGYVMGYYAEYFIFVDCGELDQVDPSTSDFCRGIDLSFYAYDHSSKAACKTVNAVKALCGLEMALWILVGLLYAWLAFRIWSKYKEDKKEKEKAAAQEAQQYDVEPGRPRRRGPT